MVAGVVLGAVMGERVAVVQPLGDLFINLLVLAAVPLVFFNLLAGLAALADKRALGRLAGKTLGYYLTTDVIALALGLGAAALLRPGDGMQLAEAVTGPVGEVPSIASILLGMIPTNVFRAFSDGNVVQIVVLALLVGVATITLRDGPRARLATAWDDLAALFRRLVHLILWTAPVGIGALVAVTVGRYGAELIGPMARFLAGLWIAQLAVVAGYLALLRFFSDFRPVRFLRETGSLWATTAATTSSLASLSVGMETARKIGLPRRIFAFSLPLGAQLNKDGTSAMLGAVLVFTAQAAGVSFTPADLLTILLLGLLLSEASGGIPGGGFVIALIYVQAFNLPVEVAAIVGGIYRLVDIGNTTVNIMGDMVGTSLVARSEARREQRGVNPSVRALFPGAEEQVYLDISARTLVPEPVRAAINDHLRTRMLRGGDKDAMRAVVERARSSFAALIGARADEIAITKNVSEGLNLFGASLPWKPGDNVVLCPALEHPNNIYLWHNLARLHGIEVRTVEPRRTAGFPSQRWRRRSTTAPGSSRFPASRSRRGSSPT